MKKAPEPWNLLNNDHPTRMKGGKYSRKSCLCRLMGQSGLYTSSSYTMSLSVQEMASGVGAVCQVHLCMSEDTAVHSKEDFREEPTCDNRAHEYLSLTAQLSAFNFGNWEGIMWNHSCHVSQKNQKYLVYEDGEHHSPESRTIQSCFLVSLQENLCGSKSFHKSFQEHPSPPATYIAVVWCCSHLHEVHIKKPSYKTFLAKSDVSLGRRLYNWLSALLLVCNRYSSF